MMPVPSSGVPLQSSSTALQLSVTLGEMAAVPSLQSPVTLENPAGQAPPAAAQTVNRAPAPTPSPSPSV